MARLLRTTSIVDPAPIGLVALWGATSSKPWRSGDGRRVSPCSVRRASVLPYTVASMAVQCVELDVEDAVGEMDLKDGVEGQRRPIRPFPLHVERHGSGSRASDQSGADPPREESFYTIPAACIVCMKAHAIWR